MTVISILSSKLGSAKKWFGPKSTTLRAARQKKKFQQKKKKKRQKSGREFMQMEHFIAYTTRLTEV